MKDEDALLVHVAKAIRLSLQEPYENLQAVAMQLEEREDPVLQRQTGVMLRGIYQLQRIAANLELYSRLSSGEYGGQLQRTELTGFFAQLCDRAGDLLSYLPRSLRSDLPKKRCYGNLDRYLTEQIFWHLLTNAAAAATEPSLDLSVRREGRFLYLALTETAKTGSSQAFSDALAGNREEPQETPEQRGVGLGLSVIRLAAERHGGAAIVSRGEKDRVTVTVSLDLELPAVKEQEQLPEILEGLDPDLAAMSCVLPPTAFDSRDIL